MIRPRRHPAPPTTLVAVLVIATASCDGPRGVGEALHVDELPLRAYVEEVRIGSRSDPEAGFSSVGDLAVADDGSLYVVESQAREIRVYDRRGRRVGVVGGPGEGPGEFRRIASMGLVADTLWVRHGVTGRISWFGPDGALVHETTPTVLPVETDVPGMSLQVTPGDPRPDGFVGSSYMRVMGGGAADRPFFHPVVRFDRDGNVHDTLRWDTVRVGPTVRVGGRSLHPPALRPSSPVVEEVGDDRLEVSWSVPAGQDGVMEVVRLTSRGDTVARRSLRYQAVPVPGRVRDSLLERPDGMGRLYGVSDGELAAAMASGLELPDHRPPLRSMEAGHDGSLWIELNEASTDSAHWVLLEPDLSPRGRLTLPVGMELRHVDGGVVWAVELDELDVPFLVRLRVQ